MKCLSISLALMLVGSLGILLIAMLDDDFSYQHPPNEKHITPGSETGIEDLLNCNIWELLLFICGAMIVGPILYLLPFDLPSWVHYPLICILTFIFYLLVKKWLHHLRLKWAEEDKQLRRTRSNKRKGKKKKS